MRVVIVSDHGKLIGGAEAVALSSAAALANAGCDVLFASVLDPLDAKFQGLDNLSSTQIESSPFWDRFWKTDKLSRLSMLRFDPVSSEGIAKVLAGVPLEGTVVHFHMIQATLGGPAIRQAMEMGFAVVVSCHDYSLVCPEGGYYLANEAQACPLKPLSVKCWATQCLRHGTVPQKLSLNLRTAAQRSMVAKLTDVVCPTSFSRSKIEPYLDSRTRVHTLALPIEVERGPAVEVAKNSGFLWAGRLSREKDPVFFAQATRDAGVKAVIAGTGDLTDETATTNPEAQMLGWQNREQMQAAYGSCRALVSTSRCYETAGMVVPESLSRGIPVIVPSTAAARDFIDEGRTGLIYESGNQASLIAALKQLEDPAFASEMGRNAYDDYWQNPFTIARHLEGLLRIYEGALAALKPKYN